MKIAKTTYIRNKKVSFEYSMIEEYTSGICLKGYEIKSIRESKCQITESFCEFQEGELFLVNMHIDPYKDCSPLNPTRDRKLLLNRKELNSLKKGVEIKGMTIVLKALFINELGYCKLNIALAKGKKLHDKRNSIKEKDLKRDQDRELKGD